MPKPLPVLLLCAWATSLAACAASAPVAPLEHPAAPGHGLADPPPDARRDMDALAAAPSARDLSSESSYGDLVRLARTLSQDGLAPATGPCLLQRRADGVTLTAELMPALERTPDAAPQLGALMGDHQTPIRVLTRWGSVGRGQGVVAATLTAVPPTAMAAPATLAVATSAGIFLRYGARDASGTADGPLTPEAAAARLLRSDPGGAHGAVLYVAAEGAAPMIQLAALLSELPEDLPVALAVVLPAGTALPAPAPAKADAQRCPSGLPELAEEEQEGTLTTDVIVAALAPLKRGAASCLSRARGASAAGGKLTLALRIGATGQVQESCLLADEIADDALGACVLDAADTLRFPPPSPAGSVDLHLPLSLTPQASEPVRAICGAR